MIYIDAANDDGIGGADIIYQKEIIKKIPEKSGCLKNATIQSFVKCRKTSLKQFLEYAIGRVILKSIFDLVRYVKSRVIFALDQRLIILKIPSDITTPLKSNVKFLHLISPILTPVT